VEMKLSARVGPNVGANIFRPARIGPNIGASVHLTTHGWSVLFDRPTATYFRPTIGHFVYVFPTDCSIRALPTNILSTILTFADQCQLGI
jgi:hypothetical protein